MGIITPSRNDLFQEETDFKSGASESMFTRFGATNNFINRYQHTSKEFFLNGGYRANGSLSKGIDGLHIFQTNSEIVGVTLFSLVSGTGFTTLDVHWLNAPSSDQGSIFSTKPTFDGSSLDDSYMVKDLIDGNDINPIGTTLPVLSKTQFLKGEAIRVDLDLGMTGAKSCGMIINFRPIN